MRVDRGQGRFPPGMGWFRRNCKKCIRKSAETATRTAVWALIRTEFPANSVTTGHGSTKFTRWCPSLPSVVRMPIRSATLAGANSGLVREAGDDRRVSVRVRYGIHVVPEGTAPCPSEDTALQSTNRINRPSERELEQSSHRNGVGEAVGSPPGVRMACSSATLMVLPSITK